MNSNHLVSVVVPCFNEGEVVRETVAGLASLGLTVIVVDDGSVPPLEALADAHVLRHSVNLGQGAALQTGMDYALALGSEFVIHFDADGQHDREAIRPMLDILRSGTADVVLGSRFLHQEHARAVPALRRWVLRGGIAVSWLFSGLWLTDTHNGFRGLTAAAARRLRLRENGFGHATEILAEIRQSGLRYQELPTLVRYTDYSLAKGQRAGNGLNVVIDLVLRVLIR